MEMNNVRWLREQIEKLRTFDEFGGNFNHNAVFVKRADVLALLNDPPALAGSDPPAHPSIDDLGLSIDMIDADRLRDFARNIETHGADLLHWASPLFLVKKLREMAGDIETAVRDIGTLRQRAAEAALPSRKGPDAGGRVQPDAPTIEKCDLECGDFWFKGKVCRHGRTAEQMR